MRIALITSCFLLVASAQALTDTWGVDVQQHTAVQRTYKQGETWSMQITLRDGLKSLDLTGATAKWYWYTNTTANIWWTNSAAITLPKSGIVTAQWTPAMDVGASSYAYWVGIWMPGATSPLWRVTGNIRMLPSPGFTPNALPMPIRTLDFAAITITNAPWVTAADWASGSNALASAVQSHAQRTDNPHGVTASQIGALTSESDTLALSVLATNRVNQIYGTNQWIDGDGSVWTITYTVESNVICTLSNPFGKLIAPDTFDHPYQNTYVSAPNTEVNADNNWYINFDSNSEGLWNVFNYGYGIWWGASGYDLPLVAIGGMGECVGTATFDWLITYTAVTTRVDEVAFKSDLASTPSYPTNLIAGFAMTIPNTNAVYQLTVDSNRVLTVWEVLP